MAELEIFVVMLEDSPVSMKMFPVKAAASESVGEWRNRVYKKRLNRLKGYDANDLILWKLNKAITSNEVDKEVAALGQHLSAAAVGMLPANKLSYYFSTPPAEGCLHVILTPPGYVELKVQKPTSPELVAHVDAIKFLVEKVLHYTIDDLKHASNNTHLHKSVRTDDSSPFGTGAGDTNLPPFVSEFLGTLDARRPVSQAQLQQLPQIFDQETHAVHFDASDGNEMHFIELSTYSTGLQSHLYRSKEIQRLSSAFKDGHVTVHLVDPALTRNHLSGESWCYNKDVGWNPLLLQGTLADPGSLYTFKPRSDFCLFEATYGPLIMGEIISEGQESDRWRMLFEGTAVCRYQNNIRGDRRAIILCLYLNKRYEMEHYLVYQAVESDTRDVHILHDITLDLTKIKDTFLLSKRLFNFRDCLIQFPEIDEERQEEIDGIQLQVRELYKVSATAAANQAKSKGGRSSQPSAMISISEDAVLQASFKAIRALSPIQKDVAAAIRYSDMQPVVLKRVRTNSSELRILRLLQSRALQGPNHIIPLLEVIERPPGISTLVMPHYTPILELSTGRGEELALQLIRGVGWLHKHLISHSDIKRRNLVFDERRNHLFIIDFGLAIQLTSREQKVRGARGTADHVAPEVGITSSWESGLEEVTLDEDSIYSPILADVWAVGDVINRWLQSSTKSIQTMMGKVAKELQADNPTKRISLHDAERQIGEACSMAATAPGPLAAPLRPPSPWAPETHYTVSTRVVLQA